VPGSDLTSHDWFGRFAEDNQVQTCSGATPSADGCMIGNQNAECVWHLINDDGQPVPQNGCPSPFKKHWYSPIGIVPGCFAIVPCKPPPCERPAATGSVCDPIDLCPGCWIDGIKAEKWVWRSYHFLCPPWTLCLTCQVHHPAVKLFIKIKCEDGDEYTITRTIHGVGNDPYEPEPPYKPIVNLDAASSDTLQGKWPPSGRGDEELGKTCDLGTFSMNDLALSDILDDICQTGGPGFGNCGDYYDWVRAKFGLGDCSADRCHFNANKWPEMFVPFPFRLSSSPQSFSTAALPSAEDDNNECAGAEIWLEGKADINDPIQGITLMDFENAREQVSQCRAAPVNTYPASYAYNVSLTKPENTPEGFISNPILRSPEKCADFRLPSIFTETEAQQECCISLEHCYQTGGTWQNRLVCDYNYFVCLERNTPFLVDSVGDTPWAEVGLMSYLTEGPSTVPFNKHNDKYACVYYSKGEGIDNLLNDPETVWIKSCQTCNDNPAEPCHDSCLYAVPLNRKECQKTRGLRWNSAYGTCMLDYPCGEILIKSK